MSGRLSTCARTTVEVDERSLSNRDNQRARQSRTPLLSELLSNLERSRPPPMLVDTGRTLTRSERFTLAMLALLSLVLRGLAYFQHRFDSDEPQHLHVTWGWTAGLLQYRDLFDNHAPLFHMLTAPILRLVGERPDVLLYMRAPMLALFAIVLVATYLIGQRLYSSAVGLWAALLLSLFPPFFLKSLEYRTDNLWMVFWCLAVVVLIRGPLTPTRLFVVGLL